MMKKFERKHSHKALSIIYALLLMNGFFPSNCRSTIDSVKIFPPAPTSQDSVIIRVAGWFPNTGYLLDTVTVAHLAYQFNVNVMVSLVGGIVLPVIIPYTFERNLGLLYPGEYLVSVTEWHTRRDTITIFPPIVGDTASTRFSVTVPVSIRETPTQLPARYSLVQNYPNPFNPETVFQYQLPKQAEVRLEIYNVVGELVRTLVDEKQPAGYYTVRWNGRDEQEHAIASGVYLYRLTAGEFVQVRKKL